MRVICIDNKHYPVSLTLNKEYSVVREEEFFFVITDDSFEEYFFSKELFRVIE